MPNLSIRAIAATLLLATAALASPAHAADANKATQAELEAVKGIGPAMAERILEERKKAPFKNWADMIDRVKGLGEGNAARYSEAGLTVGADKFTAAPAKAVIKPEPKADMKADPKKG